MPGTTPFPPAANGAWTAGPVSEVPDPKLQIRGSPALNQATCTFTFSGATSSTPPVSVAGTSVVVLMAGATKLVGASGHVLVTGDQHSDAFGNRLAAQASLHLKTV